MTTKVYLLGHFQIYSALNTNKELFFIAKHLFPHVTLQVQPSGLGATINQMSADIIFF